MQSVSSLDSFRCNMFPWMDENCSVFLFSFADKPGMDEALKLSEIGEQFENIRLTRDPAERLQMQQLLG